MRAGASFHVSPLVFLERPLVGFVLFVWCVLCLFFGLVLVCVGGCWVVLLSKAHLLTRPVSLPMTFCQELQRLPLSL